MCRCRWVVLAARCWRCCCSRRTGSCRWTGWPRMSGAGTHPRVGRSACRPMCFTCATCWAGRARGAAGRGGAGARVPAAGGVSALARRPSGPSGWAGRAGAGRWPGRPSALVCGGRCWPGVLGRGAAGERPYASRLQSPEGRRILPRNVRLIVSARWSDRMDRHTSHAPRAHRSTGRPAHTT